MRPRLAGVALAVALAVPAACSDSLPATDVSADVETSDGPIPDGPIPDGSIPDGKVPDSVSPDAPPPLDAPSTDLSVHDVGLPPDGPELDMGATIDVVQPDWGAVTPSGTCPQTPHQNLQLCVSFDNVQGMAVMDESGHDRHGAMLGTVQIAPGKFGDGVKFDGTLLQSVTFGHILDSKMFLTIELWVKLNGIPNGWETLVNNWLGNAGYWLGASSDALGVEWWIDGTYAATPSIFPLTTNWKHVAATFNAITGVMRIYLNGNLRAFTTRPGLPSFNLVTLELGRGGGVFKPLRGVIDEFKVWNAVRTPQQICEDAGGTYASLKCTLP